MGRSGIAAFALALCAAAGPASAGEVFGGLYAHAVRTPFSLETGEGGADLQLGFRGAPIPVLKNGDGPAPYVVGSLNTAGDTSFVAAGGAWTVPLGKVYLRPALGLSYNDGVAERIDPVTSEHLELGSRVLFHLEAGLGVAVGPRTTLEASWAHISGGRVFNYDQNPGIDMIGVRINQRL